MIRANPRLPFTLRLGLMACVALIVWIIWTVGREPYAFSAVYVDGLAAYCMLIILVSTALQLWSTARGTRAWHELGLALCAMLACLVAWPLVFACLLGICFALEKERWRHMLALWRSCGPAALRAQWQSIAALVALLLALALLSAGGARRFDAPSAGTGFTSLVFWLIVLGIALQLLQSASFIPHPSCLSLWLYLLARLYSLGPWLPDWSLATITLGLSLVCWQSIGFARQTHVQTQLETQDVASLPRQCLFGLALISVGLGTSAGIGALCLVLLAMALRPALIALPFSMGFVLFWAVIAAAAAAGMSIVAGILWFVFFVLAVVHHMQHDAELDIRALGWQALLVGCIPALYGFAIQPVVEQLQGGLTPYGMLSSRPWLGLLATNAANHGMFALPNLALMGLLAVLVAGIYLFNGSGRCNTASQASIEIQQTVQPDTMPRTFLPTIALLREQIPWLHTAGFRRGQHEPD